MPTASTGKLHTRQGWHTPAVEDSVTDKASNVSSSRPSLCNEINTCSESFRANCRGVCLPAKRRTPTAMVVGLPDSSSGNALTYYQPTSSIHRLACSVNKDWVIYIPLPMKFRRYIPEQSDATQHCLLCCPELRSIRGPNSLSPSTPLRRADARQLPIIKRFVQVHLQRRCICTDQQTQQSPNA